MNNKIKGVKNLTLDSPASENGEKYKNEPTCSGTFIAAHLSGDTSGAGWRQRVLKWYEIRGCKSNQNRSGTKPVNRC